MTPTARFLERWEATLTAQRKNDLEEIARQRNELYDERIRLTKWSQRLTERNTSINRKARKLMAGQEVRRQERAEIKAERAALIEQRKDLNREREAFRQERGEIDEPETTQLRLMGDYLPIELTQLRDAISELRERDSDLSHHLIAKALDRCQEMTAILREECRRDEMRKRGKAA